MISAPRNAVFTVGLALAAFLGASSLTSCSDSPKEDLEAAVAEAIEKTPTKAEFPALSSEMLRALSADVPALAPRLAALERSEKANLARAATLMREWAKEGEPAATEARPQAALTPTTAFGRSAKFDPLGWLVPPAQAQDGSNLLASLSGFSAGLTMAGLIGSGSEGKTESGTRTVEGDNGEKVTVTRELRADGTVTVSLESNIDIVPLGVVGGTKTKVSSKTFCPDANGKVEFTITMEQQATANGLGSLVQQSGVFEAVVEVTTNESGEIASTVMTTKYNRQSSGKGGASSASGSADWSTVGGDVSLTGEPEGTAKGQAGEAFESSAATSAAVLGHAAADGASIYWQSNNCVRIDADVPGQVKPGATTEIPVKVVHKQDGNSVPARVDAKLDGGKSLTPVVIRRAPGSLTHVAPNKTGVQMTIDLKARSRRGSAVQQFFLKTVDACYSIEGGGGEFKGTGETCDLTQPFRVEGNADIVVDFSPTDANGGTYSYTGRIMGAKLSGKGTYKVQYNGEVPIGITGSGPGTACTPMGCFTSPGKEKYTLTAQE